MTVYKVERSVLKTHSGGYVVKGLEDWDGCHDTLLATHQGETDITSAEEMKSALCELTGRTENVIAGDTFETPFGSFAYKGAHVVPA